MTIRRARQLPHHLWLGHISAELQALPPLLLHQSHSLVSILVLVQVQNRNVSPLASEVHGDSTPNARVAACQVIISQIRSKG